MYNMFYHSGNKEMLNRCVSYNNLQGQRQSSLSNITNTTAFRGLTLKKSIFNPPQGLEEAIRQRCQIKQVQVPQLTFLISSPRWLLLQSPLYSTSFFKRLDAGLFGNPYQILLQILNAFVKLSELYGYFGVTAKMILVKKQQFYVWINQDIFSQNLMEPLKYGSQGQKQFLHSFIKLIQSNFYGWQKTSSIFTINDLRGLLKWRSESVVDMQTSTQTVKKGHVRVKAKGSYQHQEIISHQDQYALRAVRSTQTLPSLANMDYFQKELSSSLTIKELEKRITQTSQTNNQSQIFRNKQSIQFTKKGSKISDSAVRQTKKKFHMISLSNNRDSSDKFRTTAGKKKEMGGSVQERQKQISVSPVLSHISDQLDGLFASQERSLELGDQGNKQQLERIAQEIEDVLIW